MLCQATQKQARWIWTSLRTARSHKSKIGEESITDFLILQLKKESKGTYYIDTFTRPKEKISGADWELWLTGPSGKWLGLRVQAKIISIDGKRYSQLHYKRKDGTHQIDQLIADARKHRALPLYCLYSYWKSSDVGKIPWPCGTFKKNSRLFGASWMSVDAVQALKTLREDSLKKVAKSLHPFHCLFCCHGHGSGDLPTRANAFLSHRGYAISQSSLLLNEPPYYVSQLVRSEAMGGDLVDLHDENLYRVTVVGEVTVQEPNLSIDVDPAR
jgi:hypothetical protein